MVVPRDPVAERGAWRPIRALSIEIDAGGIEGFKTRHLPRDVVASFDESRQASGART